MIYICRRGRENLKELKRDHFTVQTDSDGRQYVAQAVDEMTKKTREDNRSSRKDAGRMYETGTKSCPVASFQKYVSQLNPECDSFFQTPKTVAPKVGPWYKKTPVGRNTLGNLMLVLSKKANLSKLYTNHCLRATCISILDTTGFPAREICQVSGHANEGSLSSYTGRVSDDRKHKMSDALSHALRLSLGPNQQKHAKKTEIEKQALASTTMSTSTMPSVRAPAPATVSTAPPEIGDTMAECPNPFPEVDFDLGFTLSNSQEVAIREFEFEETYHSQSQESNRNNNILVPSNANADNTTVARDSSINSVTSDTRGRARSTTTSTTNTMQFQQTPFVLNNCNVTINYHAK